MDGGGAAAAAAARGSAVQSSAHGAAGAAASATGKLKGKGDDRVTRLPAEAPLARVLALARTPAQGPPPKSRHQELALRLCPSALVWAQGPPCGARPGAPTAPAHPSSPPGLNLGPLPAAPPGPHSSLPAVCKAPERSPTPDGTPTKMPGPRGALGRRCVGCRGCGPWGSSPGTHRGYLLPSPYPRHKLSQACFGGKRERGHLQVSFTDFGTITVSAPRISPPWALGRAPHPRRRRLPRRERGREKKLRLPCPSPVRVLPGPGLPQWLPA